MIIIANNSANVLKITPDGTVTEIMGREFDGHTTAACSAVATDKKGNVFITKLGGQGAFRIAPDGSVSRIIDTNGDGKGEILKTARSITIDSKGRVYIAGYGSQNIFRIDPPFGPPPGAPKAAKTVEPKAAKTVEPKREETPEIAAEPALTSP